MILKGFGAEDSMKFSAQGLIKKLGFYMVYNVYRAYRVYRV